jgi:phospholipid-binding lipoprotein MlaA
MNALRLARTMLGAFGLACLAACTTTGADVREPADYDPIEGFNRYVFEVNRFGDEFVLKPVAVIYRGTVPQGARQSVTNALGNLRLPWTFLNGLMQGSWNRAGDAAVRFGVNSTVGFFGLFDPAKDMGYLQLEEDFGQTMGVWGVGDSPYLVLPLVGPSNLRDMGGLVVDQFLDPVNLVARGGINLDGNWFTYTRGGLSAVDQREHALEAIAELERGSVDFYATMRSAYLQRRLRDIRNTAPDDQIPGLFR